MYENIVKDIINHPKVQEMKDYRHHHKIDCLSHSIHVSRLSYKLAKRFGMDEVSVARGALLHDFYLYDWHIRNSHKGLHGFNHAKEALKNAEMYFDLNSLEKDIIKKHMWPLNLGFPSYRESYLVMFVDKYCSLVELFRSYGSRIFS
jgi:uncharacterized protein